MSKILGQPITIGGAKSGGNDHVPVLGTDFTYTGTCEVVDDSDEVMGTQWHINFLTSGTLTTAEEWKNVDIFLVGGGGNGATGTSNGGRGGAGGKGGTCKTVTSLSVPAKTAQAFVIGGAGGTTSALGQSAAGGTTGGGASGATSYSVNGDSGYGGTYAFGATTGTAYGANGAGGGFGSISSSAPTSKDCSAGGTGANGSGKGGHGAGTNSYSTNTAHFVQVYNSSQKKYITTKVTVKSYRDAYSSVRGDTGAANTGAGGGGGGAGARLAIAQNVQFYSASEAARADVVDQSINTSGAGGGVGGSGIIIMRKHKD